MQSKTTTYSLIALSALLALWLAWSASLSRAHIASLEHALETARAHGQQSAATHTTSAPPPPSPLPACAPARTIVEPPHAAPNAANLAKLNDDLAAARTRISELESKVLSLDADRANLAQQRQQEATSTEEASRARIAEAEKALQAAQSEIKSARDRAALFETENENLRKAAAKNSDRSTPNMPVDDLARRREAYFKSLIRRYREIDNDYRALLRDSQGNHATDPALLRIQATLAQAEEDLRQIDSLNAKTLLVEKHK